ncbi:hypothetical protein EVAR_55251_1 [Eumeta japonica]|uniref:DOMON domain-containing protein n=1 Tax=Eumeta variegata TaxID=151549 RepID=A0A4C1Z1Z7_EUMVA|nr:hypothetical protein EVAR_55251_1 [Eumeta japonica]
MARPNKENTNSVRLLNAALVNGYSIVTYQRSLRAADELDLPIWTNASQPIIWAIGPLNSRNQVSYHSHFTKGDKFIEFARPPLWNCPMPETEEEHQQHHRDPQPTAVIKPNPVPTPKPVPRVEPWDIPAIQCDEPEDGVFYAQMGPTGGKQGYSAITGHVGWGISWYINGLLIPEINVVRGRRYTFVVEGGSNPDVPARYHPFYITNDPVGGYLHKTDTEKQGVEIYAGVRRTRSGELIPTGVGRLCNWIHDSNEPEADDYPSFGAFQRSLTLVCEEGNPGVITWTPDKKTPDTVYYQCFTHRYLGWKINVLDECDASGEASAPEPQILQPDMSHDPLLSQESVQVVTRVKPDNNLLLDQRTKLQKIINTKDNEQDNFSNGSRHPLGNVHEHGSLAGEVGNSPRLPHATSSGNARPTEYEVPISKMQMKQVIEAVESLESQLKNDLKKQQSFDNTHATGFKGSFLPERPVREDEEYFVEPSRQQIPYMLPPNQKPLTLQTVLRPNGKPFPPRPYRRPGPPEIKLRRPQYQKPGFPLPMSGSQGASSTKKHSYKLSNGRMPQGASRLPLGPMPPTPINLSAHHSKPNFVKAPPKIVSKSSGGLQSSNILGKPTMAGKTQTLTLGKSDIIGNQVVKGQITLPFSNEPISLHSIPQSVVIKPGQIILGKPVENPQPLDPQLIQIKPQGIRVHPTSPPDLQLSSSTSRIHTEPDIRSILKKVNMKSSDFIRESTDTSATVIPAVNTGFKPDSIVVESGFKPIIREPLMAAEDRITDFDGTSNRREDTDIQEDYEEVPQHISNHAYPNEKQAEKQTESFEPMFIPSPLDHSLSTGDRTIEIFPNDNAKEQRPHPVYKKTDNRANELFSKFNMDKDVPDMIMEADRVNAHYLPPDPKTPERAQKISAAEATYTTYDGKIISAATLTSVPNGAKNNTKLFSSKLPTNTELLLKTPQFGPFKGEIPSVIAEQLDKPPNGNDQNRKELFNTRTTHLKLVNSLRSEDISIETGLKEEASEIHETKVENPDKEDHSNGEDEDYEYEEEIEEERKNRAKRDIKTAQFDRATSVETVTKPEAREINNQVNFDDDYLSNSSSITTKSKITSILLLTIWLRRF